MISGLEPACQSGPDVAAYPELLPSTLGEHVEQTVSLAMSPGARLLRSVRALLVRRAEVCAIVPGSAPRKHAPPSGAPRQERGGDFVGPRRESRGGFSEQQVLKWGSGCPDPRGPSNQERGQGMEQKARQCLTGVGIFG